MAEQIVEPVQNVAEEWRIIKDYPKYEVSNLGRLRKGNRYFVGWVEKGGYTRITLTTDKTTKNFRLHRVVAEAFIPNPENKPEVNHLGAKTDNRVCMLEWATRSENCIHAVKFIKKKRLNYIKINKIDSETNEIVRTYTEVSTMENDGYDNKCVIRCYKGERKTYKGFKWERIDEKNIENINKDEIWKPLKESIYEDSNKFINYEISNYGRVRNTINGKLLKPYNYGGYMGLPLKYNGMQKTFKIHRLVLMAFNIPNPDNKKEIDHIDSNPLNNKLENLKWSTREEQINNKNTIEKRKITAAKKKLNKPQKINKKQAEYNRYKVKIKAYNDNEEIIYNSKQILCKTMNMCAKTLNRCLINNMEHKGYKYKLLDNNQKPRKPNGSCIKTSKPRKTIKIKVINSNNEETIYNCHTDAFNDIKVGLKTIRKYSRSGTAYKGYRFEILNDK
jgi:hypothetical protein